MYAVARPGSGMDARTGLGKVIARPLGKWSAMQYSADTELIFHVGGFKEKRGPNGSNECVWLVFRLFLGSFRG